MTEIAHARPMLRKAADYLLEHVSSNSMKPGDLLPTLRELRIRAGVSHVTMFKALREAKAAGLLSVVNKRAYAVADPKAGCGRQQPLREAPPSAQPRLRTWQRISQRIADDVTAGVYRPGASLPSMKELQRRYGVSFRTIRAALGDLVGAHVLMELTNGDFAAPSLSACTWRPRITCVIGAPDTYHMSFGQHDEAVFRALEVLCEQAGIAMDIFLGFTKDGDPLYRFRHKSSGRLLRTRDLARAGAESLGFVYILFWKPGATDEEAVRSILANEKPLAILDEAFEFRLPSHIATSRLVRTFTAAGSPGSGRSVALKLLSLGHRKVAFFSTQHQCVWSRARLEGLTSGFTEAGLPAGVVPFVTETVEHNYAERARQFHLSSLTSFYRKWRMKIPEPLRIDFDRTVDSIDFDACSQAEQRALLLPLLENASKDPAITAWVMVNDSTATKALPFLDGAGLRVPADVSMVSFDDSPEALRHSLSSYNFNPQAVAAAMLGFILDKKPFSNANPGEWGFIVDRGALGPARHGRTGRL